MYLGCATYNTHVHGKYVDSTDSANKGKFPGWDTNPLWVVSEMTSDLGKKNLPPAVATPCIKAPVKSSFILGGQCTPSTCPKPG